MTHLVKGPIDVGALMARAGDPACGAVVLFLGVVRNHSEGRAVVRVEYTAYEPMAERELARIAEAGRKAGEGVRLQLVHRLGMLEVGDASVAIAAAAPHRAEAYAACREAIEAIKRSVPIWKREVGPDGTEWVEPACSHG